MSDPRQAAVERAIRAGASALLARKLGIGEVLATVAAAMADAADEATPREFAAAARQGHRAKVVAEIVRLEQQGQGRAAAMILARSNAADARDPIELETLANRYRRWRRTEKRASARLPALRSDRNRA